MISSFAEGKDGKVSPLRFSIVTVCKNPGDSIIRSMESINCQSARNYEWIVVDGASIDGTPERLKNTDSGSLRMISEIDQGIYDAMNKGVKLAKGDYVFFLNSGDTFHDANVLQVASEMIDRDSPDIIYGNSNLINPTDQVMAVKSHSMVDKYFLFNRPINHQAIFARRTLFLEKIGLFDTSYVVKADHDWIMRCWKAGVSSVYVDKIIVNYELGGFAFQYGSRYGVLEKKRIQNAYFNRPGATVVRIANRLNYQPAGWVRKVINKML
jgi:glycosyltransferase involved in cell wall biosynthesis